MQYVFLNMLCYSLLSDVEKVKIVEWKILALLHQTTFLPVSYGFGV